MKKLFFGSLVAGAALALTRIIFARPNVPPAAAKQASGSDSYEAGTSYEAINAYVERQMRRLSIPGAALVIVEGDQIVHLRGFGKARPGGEMPAPQTPFFIGSLTKSFTALAVMQLVEAGKVELDAPVQRYLPWFRVADPRVSAQMTVRHLLNQTSGLPMPLGMIYLANFDSRPNATERQARALASLKLKRPPGAAWEYSNLNYNLLGLVVEAASGEPYSDYIQHHIFDPLDMRHTFTSRSAAQQDGLAVGHRYWFSLPFPAPDIPVPRGSLPSGWLISCAEDMAHYLIAHLNGGRYGSTQILSEAGIDELHRGAAEYKMGNVAAGQYGMGWFSTDSGQTQILSHGGNVPDFSAYMALVPEQKKGVVLLINADHYGLPFIIDEVGMGAAALLAGQQPAPTKLGFIPWVMRLLPLIPLLQIVGASLTVQRLRRWDRSPALRPSPGRMWGQHILLPLLPNLSLAAILVYLQSSGLLRYLHIFNPDLAWIARISGGFAGVWAVLRTWLIFRILRMDS